MFQTEMEVETREKIRDTIDFSLKTKIALGEVNKKKTKTGENVAYYSYIKPLQMKGISSAIHRDTLTILPTGYGKSLIFEIIPYLLHSKIIIISPLNAIILEQVAKLGDSSLQIDTGLISDLNTGK